MICTICLMSQQIASASLLDCHFLVPTWELFNSSRNVEIELTHSNNKTQNNRQTLQQKG